MNRYLEEYDSYIDYFNSPVYGNDDTKVHTDDCPRPKICEGHMKNQNRTPQQTAALILQCQSCQDNKDMSVTGSKKKSKPLRSSKSFIGIRKSRSAEALQSMRINPVDSVLFPKSSSYADTKLKTQNLGKLRTFARWLKTKTSKNNTDNSNNLFTSQPSSSSLAPSVSSYDSHDSSAINDGVGISFNTSGYSSTNMGGSSDCILESNHSYLLNTSSSINGIICDNTTRRGSTDCVLDHPQCFCPRCQDEEDETGRRMSDASERLALRLDSVTEEDRLKCYYKYQSIRRSNPKSKHLSIGRKKFNMDPKKGIEYLIEHELLQNTADDIAQFLHKGEGLNKTAIGDYLGERNDFNIEVLKCFVSLHEFSDMILVQALRQFLWSFRLPGEAQKIDRMMESFAQRYCNSNPDVFTSTDTCYVLSFAIIMLNTSLHNPAVKDKPNVDRFISMNRGINDGGDLPQDLLTSIYDNIKKEPFKFPEDDGNDLMHTFFNPDKEGWLWKQGGRYKNWKRRWFILNDNCLYYFEYTTDKEPKGIIPLENIQVREVCDKSKQNCFELFSGSNEVIKACKTDSEGKVVEGKHHVYRMSASTTDDQDEWMKSIRASISDHPFYDMLAARRKKAQMKGK